MARRREEARRREQQRSVRAELGDECMAIIVAEHEGSGHEIKQTYDHHRRRQGQRPRRGEG